jgi:hypothetical protein
MVSVFCYFKTSENSFSAVYSAINFAHCVEVIRSLDKVTMATRFDSEKQKTGRYVEAINIEE